jgi:hypothetical protein
MGWLVIRGPLRVTLFWYENHQGLIQVVHPLAINKVELLHYINNILLDDFLAF